jgi:hypothetical protein
MLNLCFYIFSIRENFSGFKGDYTEMIQLHIQALERNKPFYMYECVQWQYLLWAIVWRYSRFS